MKPSRERIKAPSEKGSNTLREKFEEIKSRKIENPQERWVRVIHVVGCGCGESDELEAFLKVPFDSPLRNGDEIKDLYGSDYQRSGVYIPELQDGNPLDSSIRQNAKDWSS